MKPWCVCVCVQLRLHVRVYVCAIACTCACACVHVCVCVHVHACVCVHVHACVCVCLRAQHTHHNGKDGERGDELGEEPRGWLDVLLAIQHLVEDGEPLCRLLRLGPANVALDPLLKLGTGTLLWKHETQRQ